MNDTFQQVFVPASQGLIKSAPSSLIPDGSFQEAVNVRFGDGYIEKVEGFQHLFTLPNHDRVMKIHQYKKRDGTTKNIIHTRTGVYVVEETSDVPVLLTDQDYQIVDFGHVSCVNAFDEYFFTSLGTDIYYWSGVEDDKAKKLEGTFDPDEWEAGKQYQKDDIVKPSNDNYSGYIYKCIAEGTSGSTEPEWTTDFSDNIYTVDGTVHWKPCGTLEVESTSDASIRAQCIELFKGFLFIGNTEESGESHPTRLRWSQWQNPRFWHNNEDGSGMAGYIDIDDTDGKIVALKRIGDALYVYKENSILMITYTGDADNFFSKEVVTTKAGLISEDAIVELPHMNIFLGQDNIYAFDGNTCIPIGDEISDWFFNDMLGQTELRRVFGYYDEKHQEVIFCFNRGLKEEEEEEEEEDPSQLPQDKTFMVNNDFGIIYNTRLKKWSLREMGVTALGTMRQSQDKRIKDINTAVDDSSNNVIIDSAIFSKMKAFNAAGDKDGNIYIMSGYIDSRKADGYEGYVVSKTHHMEEPGKIKRLMRIQFHIQTAGDYDLYCQVGSLWNPETVNQTEDIQWSEKKYLNLKNPVPWYSHHVAPFIDVDITSRYFIIRFGTEGNGTYFKVLGYTLYYQVRSEE